MQATFAPTTQQAAITDRSDHEVVAHLQKSTVFTEYRHAFELTTGLPLSLRAVGSFSGPLEGSNHKNTFCKMMAGNNKGCSGCLMLQQRIKDEAGGEAKTLECFAGLSDSAVPIKIGQRVVAYLQTGQVFLHKPTEKKFKSTLATLNDWQVTESARELKAAYFKTPVVAGDHYASVLRLLSIFAEHLAVIGNQLVVQADKAEAPTVARSRAYITEHISEEISLAQVSRAANMSIFYFCKIFKKETGMTFTEYLARIRVEMVKKILLNPHTRISEAAFEVGFQSLSQFNRVFRRFAGESPSDYRDRAVSHDGSSHRSRELAAA